MPNDDIRIVCTPASSPDSLVGYGTVPIAFWVRSIIVVPADGIVTPDMPLVEAPIEPYLKDYDAIPGEGPARWREALDMSRWVVIRAYMERSYVGAAVVAWDTPGIHMLENRADLAVLWDIRVHPDHRGIGVGRRIFDEVERWARDRGCRELKIETQNINVPACRFYASRGCRLRAVNFGVYPDVPDEVQMFWYKGL